MRRRGPGATFVVNVAGAFLLGYFTTRLLERLPLSSYRRPALGTGLCGGLTTFSAMQLEILQMLDGGHVALALTYAATSIVAGFIAVAAATSSFGRPASGDERGHADRHRTARRIGGGVAVRARRGG